jgi:protein-tyrosine kinase
MSLVETALKKIQSARPAGAPPRPAGVASRTAADPADALPASGSVDDADTAERARLQLERPRHRTDKQIRVDRNVLRSLELLPPDHHERHLADQFRQIKRPIIAAATGRGAEKLPRGQFIMMASAMPGEGKTFTSLNLALSMALEKDISVLLVDADVAKPHISTTFGAADEPGLLDVLRDESIDVESVILPTDVPGLNILPAGRRSDTATELLASHRMDEIVAQLAARDPMRIALIDSPPLLLTSESRALAQSVGQVVLVVRAAMTPQQAVLDAIDNLGEGRPISLILNQSMAPANGYYYGYGEVERAVAT